MRSTLVLVLLSSLALGTGVTGCAANEDEDSASAEGQMTEAQYREAPAILESVRGAVQPSMGGQAFTFTVSDGGKGLRIRGNYAFVMANMSKPDGSALSTVGTSYDDSAKSGIFDGWRIEALLRKDGGRWTVQKHGIGSTDVWYWGIDQSYPDASKELFPYLDPLMDGLKNRIKPDLAWQDVTVDFTNGRFAQDGDYAWVMGNVTLPNGAAPTTKGTIYESNANSGIFDGFHIEALLKRNGTSWEVLTHGIGSTDVWWYGVAKRFPEAPKELFDQMGRGE